jgi:predicted nucleic acid-binding protein
MPLPVLAELRAGFEAGTLTHQNEVLLQRFLNQRGVQILAPDEQTTFHYARVFAVMHRKGMPLPQNDLWIAALVLQHSCVLLTYDAHFDQLPQIPRW